MARSAVLSNQQLLRSVGLGKGQLTVSTTAIGLPAPPADAAQKLLRCTIRVIGQPIRWTGSFTKTGNPTSTTGLRLYADEEFVYDGDPDDFRAIRDSTATGDATLDVEYSGA